MKILISVLFGSLFIQQAQAGTFDCKLDKNYGKQKITLTQTAFAKDDPEEESEVYEGELGNVTAEVMYLRYQDGLYLSLTDRKLGVTTQTNFDQESDIYADLSLRTPDGNYILSCKMN